jgi:hypothetical protein
VISELVPPIVGYFMIQNFDPRTEPWLIFNYHNYVFEFLADREIHITDWVSKRKWSIKLDHPYSEMPFLIQLLEKQ